MKEKKKSKGNSVISSAAKVVEEKVPGQLRVYCKSSFQSHSHVILLVHLWLPHYRIVANGN